MKKRQKRQQKNAKNASHQERVWVVAGILSILLLFAFLFFGPRSAGQAIAGYAAENSLSVSRQDNSLVVRATLAEAVDGVSFQVTGENLCDSYQNFVTVLAHWEYVESSCAEDTFTFGAASMVSPYPAGEFALAEVAFTSLTLPLTVRLHDVSVYADGNNLFDAARSDTVTFAEATQTQAEVQGTGQSSDSESSGSSEDGEDSGGGGGGGFICTCNWQCGDWSACYQGKETRTCEDLNNCQPMRTVGYRSYPVQVFGGEKPAEERGCALAVEQPVQGRTEPQPRQPAPPAKADSGVPWYLWALLGAAALTLVLLWVRHAHRHDFAAGELGGQ